MTGPAPIFEGELGFMRLLNREMFTVAPMGCFTSWAIDAVSWPIVASRPARPSSACASRNASSARLRSMN